MTNGYKTAELAIGIGANGEGARGVGNSSTHCGNLDIIGQMQKYTVLTAKQDSKKTGTISVLVSLLPSTPVHDRLYLLAFWTNEVIFLGVSMPSTQARW